MWANDRIRATTVDGRTLVNLTSAKMCFVESTRTLVHSWGATNQQTGSCLCVQEAATVSMDVDRRRSCLQWTLRLAVRGRPPGAFLRRRSMRVAGCIPGMRTTAVSLHVSLGPILWTALAPGADGSRANHGAMEAPRDTIRRSEASTLDGMLDACRLTSRMTRR